MRNRILLTGMATLVMAAFVSGAEAPDLLDMPLPAPRMEGGKPLMQVLKERKTGRDFSPRKLSVQTLSDLLWAANGVNRPDTGKRTAPSAMNWQEIEIYVVLEEGTYLYDAKANNLKAVVKGDLRKVTGVQEFVATAPLNLVFVADATKMSKGSAEDQALYAATDTGFVSQNVYLFCASEGLNTVVRGWVDRAALATAMKLPAQSKIILTQTVGYPEEKAKE